MAVITVSDVQSHLGGNSGDLGDELLVQSYIDAVVLVIERLSGPQNQASETVYRDGGTMAVVTPWPFDPATVAVIEAGTTLTVGTDFEADGDAGILWRGLSPNYRNWYPGTRTVKITATVGGATPANVRLASLELFRDWWSLRQGRPAATLGAPDFAALTARPVIPLVEQLLFASPPFAGLA